LFADHLATDKKYLQYIYFWQIRKIVC